MRIESDRQEKRQRENVRKVYYIHVAGGEGMRLLRTQETSDRKSERNNTPAAQ